MNKKSVISFLPFLFLLPGAASASPTFPVKIERTASTAPVDNALNGSVQAQTSAEKSAEKHQKPMKHAAKSSASGDADEMADALPPAREGEYTIQPGDVLQITVWKEESLDREVLVLPDGTVDFPLIGSFSALNMTPSQLQATIKHKLHSMIPGASVAVLVKATLGHTASVIGQVNKPGEIIMGHKMTVMQALSQAGGLTPYASEGRILILRTENGKESSIEFPYSDVIRGRHLDKDIVLNPGDVVVVPTASLF